MKILFKYATRSRPFSFKEGLHSIIDNVKSMDYNIMITYDTDDETMKGVEIPICNVIMNPGTSISKIHAINRGLQYGGNWDILVCMSDDMRFIQKHFDMEIREDMKFRFPDLDGCLHYPDQYQGENCMTMSIMGRKYFERQGFIYDPRFESLWCDIVEQEKATIAGKRRYIEKRLFDHLHPSFNGKPYDAQLQKTESWEVRQRDYQTYLNCKKEYDPTNIYPIRGI